MTDTKALRAATAALRMVCVSLPHLSGLAHLVRVEIDRRIPSAGIFASGRLLVNPDWFEVLAFPDQVFVIGHELLHLALETHERGIGTDPGKFNSAHDYIINDILVEALGRPVPAGGLEYCGARHMSAEQILLQGYWPPGHVLTSWNAAPGRKTALGDALSKAGLSAPEPEGRDLAGGDALSDDLERRWYPVSRAEQLHSHGRVKAAAAKASSLSTLEAAMGRMEFDRSYSGGGEEQSIAALHSIYRPPWELALQQWIEAVAPAGRSYARPSRRGADRIDVALAGRKREGWTIHILLDTSGSMSSEFPLILGAIASFCEGANVTEAHILQCDEDVTRDEYMTPEALSTFTVAGLGGSDMSPGLLLLANDPEVEVAMVITDGDINYPEEPMPYHVLWVLTWDSDRFNPPYGEILRMPHT